MLGTKSAPTPTAVDVRHVQSLVAVRAPNLLFGDDAWEVVKTSFHVIGD